MIEDGFTWPDYRVTQRAVAERLERLLTDRDGPLTTIALANLRARHGIWGDDPHSATAVLVIGCALSAGGRLEYALWATAAMELAMVSADLLDAVADGELAAYAPHGPGVVLTIAVGLVALASAALMRAPEDGASLESAVAMGVILGEGLGEAAADQARSLGIPPSSAMDAYRLAAQKSGPLGSLAARLGATLGTRDPTLLARYGRVGRHFAMFSQLANDARDAAPQSLGQKGDVREGSGTVPLVFTHSLGMPPGLSGESALRWEVGERARIAAAGGIAASIALAEGERLNGLKTLDKLKELGRPVAGLRLLLNAET